MNSVSTAYDSIFRSDLLSGQVALVTGGGTGIGRATAHELAALGAHVVLAARREGPLTATVTEIEAAGGSASAAVLDIRDHEAIESVVAGVVADHGRLDLLVNNAGGQFPAPAEAISPNGWRTVVDLNLNGTFLVTRAAFNAWMGANGGAVVSIIADMWNGFPYMAHTGAARAGVENLTRSLAVEWGARGVRVNAVAPGIIYSSGMDSYAEEFQTITARNASRIPAGRVGTESETAAAVVFLLSPAAAYITGETLKVDGGSSLSKTPMVPLSAHTAIPAYDGFHLSRPVPDAWTSAAQDTADHAPETAAETAPDAPATQGD